MTTLSNRSISSEIIGFYLSQDERRSKTLRLFFFTKATRMAPYAAFEIFLYAYWHPGPYQLPLLVLLNVKLSLAESASWKLAQSNQEEDEWNVYCYWTPP